MLDLVIILRASFLLAATAALLAHCLPSLRTRFLAYGSRQNGQPPKQLTTNPLDALATFQVPHNWFASFYLVSTLCSFIWFSQILLDQSLWRNLAALTDIKNSMTLDQIIVTWILMLLQGVRRLYESLEFTKPSNARMWIGHWALGVWFYASMSIAVWIEGAPTLLQESFNFSHLTIEPPCLRTFVGCLIFILASGVQHDCHAYLAFLKKYSVPEHPVFQRLVCPHYFVECLIYLAISIVAAPAGSLLNWTIVCALIFVSVNLGVTADGTRDWYGQKFGPDSVSGKWRMIPFVF
ncbi:hypothetical protein D6D13_07701 [Aureobasidium pullulans]|uniref:Polyprenal reductase n=1 Tax=Aureobasidium pullulans TaxID=5580 RepID=A0A4S9C9X7_AURPU|nr:hypothetical protein D6D13_07701 [Aureobasidium pullulans]